MIGVLFARDVARYRALGPRGRLAGLAFCLRAPGVHASAAYRLGRWALGLPRALRLLVDPAYWVLQLAVHVLWGIEISRHARIGPGLYIGHSGGIVVSSQAVIGARCALSQGVTIGVSGREGAPRLGDDVYVGAGAKVLGPVRVGNNAKIGANAVVYRDLPDNAVAALEPGCRIISHRGNRREPSVA